MKLHDVKHSFKSLYGRSPEGLVSAPGRVNLIGEHTDYNDGFVLPIAIERRTLAAWGRRDDGRLGLASCEQVGLEDELDLCQTITATDRHKWANYPRGVAAELLRAGLQPQPCNLLFSSDVPIGSGLSSSASLEIAAALALLTAAGIEMDRYEMARICQRAEHEFAATPCGIMDQAISALAERDHALLLDCRDGTTRQVPFVLDRRRLLVIDTQVKHELSDGGYAARRSECEQAADLLGVASLRDADIDSVDRADEDGRLTDRPLRRARHVVGETERTLRAVDALQREDFEGFGQKMYDSHASLRDLYEVSCPELDAVVDSAKRQEGVYGARMTGGGFGGCAIALVQADRAEPLTQAIQSEFQKEFGHVCPIFSTRAAGGAEVLSG